MLADTDEFYRQYVAGKSTEDLMQLMRSLKRKSNAMKKGLEKAIHREEELAVSKEIDEIIEEIELQRDYLKLAKEELASLAIDCPETKAELKERCFQEQIPNIKRIYFYFESHISMRAGFEVNFSEERAVVSLSELSLFLVPPQISLRYPKAYDLRAFQSALKALHMGEWQRNYNPERFGTRVLDGTHWSVKVSYYNGLRSQRYSGISSYPYNFTHFQSLFGVNLFSEDWFTADFFN